MGWYSLKAARKNACNGGALGNDRTILGYGRFEPDFTLCNCMMSFIEVEVDTETGKVTLLRSVLATDVGQIIDPRRSGRPAQRVPRFRGYRQRYLRGNDPQSFLRTYSQFESDRLQMANLSRVAGNRACRVGIANSLQ